MTPSCTTSRRCIRFGRLIISERTAVKWVLVIFCVLGLGMISTRADDFRSALQVINSEGSLTINDGSSFYTFKKDGSFLSGPCGISGRTMSGSWRAPGGDTSKTVLFEIDAQVGWMNGIQPPHDFRTIKMWVYPGFYRDKSATAGPYKCYFLIDEMKKKS
jgi:hypothetical protein